MIKQILVLLSFMMSSLSLTALFPQVITDNEKYVNVERNDFNKTNTSDQNYLTDLVNNNENQTFPDGINTDSITKTIQNVSSSTTYRSITTSTQTRTTATSIDIISNLTSTAPMFITSMSHMDAINQSNITYEPNPMDEPMDTTNTTSTTTTTQTHISPHPLPGWSLALILSIVTVVIIVLTSIIFIRYRRSKIPLAQPVHSLMSHINRKSIVNRTSCPIPVTSFPVVYRTKFLEETFHKEFRNIQDYSADINLMKTREVGKREENRTRNRFVDIIPFDDNYVMLSTQEGSPPSNYINASYVEGLPEVGKFIVTQGPKQNTVVEFWKMIVEKQCRTIIMLTNLQEAGRVKCFQYWPPSGQMLHFDDISLFTTEETDVHSGTMARKIEVSMEDDPESEVFSVRQLHLTNWPDHGVPETTNSLLAFLRVSRDFLSDGYTVIHCSAGVGRTGTYLALLTLTEQMRNGAESLDVFSTVKSLRERRSKMVQTEEQYVFLHQAISDFIRTGEGAGVVPGDDVLDDGVDNFGFEHVRL